MRIVLLADVGGIDGYHVGDEAMLDCAIEALRRRGEVDITVVSSDPVDTAARYGVHAIAPLGFRSDGAEARRDRRLAGILAMARGESIEPVGPDEEGSYSDIEGYLAVLHAADAVIVAGGGNLSSSWPDQLYERVAALSIAGQRGIPTVVTSQTIGPALTIRERALLAETLAGARLVGLRERTSWDLTSSLVPASTPIRIQGDDAAYLPLAAVPTFAGDEMLLDGFVALTVNPFGGGPDAEARLDGLASFVRRVHVRTGLPVAFLPHVGRWNGEAFGDIAVGEALRRRIGDGPELVVAPLLPARPLASLTRQAAVIVSTRYHPLVFGIAAGAPCLAIYQDRYTATKLAGALAQAGLAGWRLPIEALLTDLPGDVFDEVWSRREELSEHLHSVTADWPSKQEAHWDEVWQAITVGPSNPGSHPRPISGGGDPVCGEVVPKLAGLASVNVIADEHLRATEALEFNWRAAFTEAERYALSLEGAFAAGTLAHRGAAEALAITARKVDDLEARLSDLDLRRATVAADNLHLVDEIRHAERSAQAARDLVGALRERLETAIEHGATVAGALVVAETRAADLAAYVGALHATKTLRWTRPLRSIYGRFLR